MAGAEGGTTRLAPPSSPHSQNSAGDISSTESRSFYSVTPACDKSLVIPVTINGERIPAIVDTADDVTALSKEVADQLGLSYTECGHSLRGRERVAKCQRGCPLHFPSKWGIRE